MVKADPYGKYREMEVLTASAGQLVVVAYDGLLRLLSEAGRACGERDWETVNDRLIRAQELIRELDGALDERAGDVARALRSLYLYMEDRLVQANVRKDAGIIEEVAALLRPLRDAWAQAAGSAAAGEGGSRGADSA